MKQIKTETMEIMSYDEKGDLLVKALAKIDREWRHIIHHFRITPFEENLKVLKPGKFVRISIEIVED